MSYHCLNLRHLRISRHLRKVRNLRRTFAVNFSLALLCITASLMIMSPLHAADFYVNEGYDSAANPALNACLDGTGVSGPCTLRQAIILANATPAADTIYLPGPLTYWLTIEGADEDAAVTGDLDITAPLTIQTVSAALLAANGDRVFHIHSSAGTVQLIGVAINGETHDSANTSKGDAIFNAADLSLVHSSVYGHAQYGGGIYNALGATIAAEVSGIGGTADQGGGIYNAAGATININKAGSDYGTSIYGTATQGGGIYNLGDALLNGVFVTGTSSEIGGAIYTASALFTMWDSNITGTATTDGGAIYNAAGSVVLHRVGILDSTAASGGGVFNQGNMNIFNSTFSGNSAEAEGGSAIANSNHVSLENVTLAENADGVIHNAGSGQVWFINSIAWDESNTVCLGNGAYYSNEHNIVNGDCGLTGANDLDIDPKLSVRGWFGGAAFIGADYPNSGVQTYALLKSSPAIDAGAAANCGSADQRGVTRPQGAGCDLGAFELETAEADLVLTVSAIPDPAVAGGQVTHRFTVTNNGPNSTENIVFSFADLAADFYHQPDMQFKVSSNFDQFTGRKISDNTISLCCLPANISGYVDVVTTPLSGGMLTMEGTLYGSRIDPNAEYNHAILTIPVTGAPGIDVDPRREELGEIQNGAAISRTVTIYSRGDQDLQISDTSLLLNGFSGSIDPTAGTNPCGTKTPVLSPGTHCTMTISATAHTAGKADIALAFTSNDPGGIAYSQYRATIVGEQDGGDGGGCFIGAVTHGFGR